MEIQNESHKEVKAILEDPALTPLNKAAQIYRYNYNLERMQMSGSRMGYVMKDYKIHDIIVERMRHDGH